MKKKFIALAIVSIATLATTSRANAQMVSNTTPLEYQQSISGISETTNPMISPRALKDFANTHKNVRGESWIKIKDGFSVRFNSDDTRTTIFYDKKGYRTGQIKIYGEEKMLHEVRHTVKSKYYDYNIVYTQEVEVAGSEGTPTYVICLEDKTNIKMIRICDGEMDVWKEYTKSN